jgi:hypothetical protein
MQDNTATAPMNISLNNIGDRLAGAHELATSIKADCEAMKIYAHANVADTVKLLNTSLDEFNKSMDETIAKLNKLLGA